MTRMHLSTLTIFSLVLFVGTGCGRKSSVYSSQPGTVLQVTNDNSSSSSNSNNSSSGNNSSNSNSGNNSSGSSAIALGGTLKNLPSGASITLYVGSDRFTLNANGPFTLGSYALGASKSVSIGSTTSSQCGSVSVGNGSPNSTTPTSASLVMDSGSASALTIDCNFHAIGGTIAGLSAGQSVMLKMGDLVTSGGNGSFTFGYWPPFLPGQNYDVEFYDASSPSPGYPNIRCTLSGNSGTVPAGAGGPLNTVSVNCSQGYTVSVLVAGLYGSNQQLGMELNYDEQLSTDWNASFTSVLNAGSNYYVNINHQPSGYTCYINGGNSAGNISGTVGSSNLSLNATCKDLIQPRMYSAGGLLPGESCTVQIRGTFGPTPVFSEAVLAYAPGSTVTFHDGIPRTASVTISNTGVVFNSSGYSTGKFCHPNVTSVSSWQGGDIAVSAY